MNAVVLNKAHIGHGSIIGANALVPQNTIIPPFSLVLGTPAKVVKTLGPETLDRIQSNVDEYIHRAQSYREHYAQQTQ
jgi:carbonic anhydrase/acetyltransferase-like protein (isoleucine patch superfamily)